MVLAAVLAADKLNIPVGGATVGMAIEGGGNTREDVVLKLVEMGVAVTGPVMIGY